MIRVTTDELSILSEASNAMYGENRSVPRGAVVRRLCEEFLEEEEE